MPYAAAPPDLLSPGELFVAVVVVGALAMAVGAVFVRVVRAGEGLVVSRAGRVTRVRTEGWVVVLPGLDRVTRVGTRPRSVDPLVARGRTTDDLDVIVTAGAVVRVSDPKRAAVASYAPFARAAEHLEAALTDAVAMLDVRELSRTSAPELRRRALERAAPALQADGLVAERLAVVSVELLAGPRLLAWADQQTEESHASHR